MKPEKKKYGGTGGEISSHSRGTTVNFRKTAEGKLEKGRGAKKGKKLEGGQGKTTSKGEERSLMGGNKF